MLHTLMRKSGNLLNLGHDSTSVSKHVVHKTIHKNKVVILATVLTVVNSSPGFIADSGPMKTNNA